MKPVLIVEGKRYEGEVVMYSYFDENDVPHAVGENDVEAIEFEGLYEGIENALLKRIEAYEEVQADYEAELMQEFKDNLKLPCENPKLQQLAVEHENLSVQIAGLNEALIIIRQHSFVLRGEKDAEQNQPF